MEKYDNSPKIFERLLFQTKLRFTLLPADQQQYMELSRNMSVPFTYFYKPNVKILL